MDKQGLSLLKGRQLLSTKEEISRKFSLSEAGSNFDLDSITDGHEIQLTLDDVESASTDSTVVQTELGDLAVTSAPISSSSGDSSVVEEASKFGFEGDPCPECGQFTLVSNGSCLKCVSCGSTTGCS